MKERKLSRVFQRMITLVLILVMVCSLGIPAMAEEMQETTYYPKTVSINSNTNPFYSPAHPDHTGEHHVIATVQTTMMIPKWVFYKDGNNGSARYYLTARFERYVKDGVIGYKALLTAHFYANNDPTKVFHTIDIGDGDEVWKGVNYNNGVQQSEWETFTDALILNRDMSKVQQLTTYDGSASISNDTDHTINIGEGVKIPDPGQITITKTVSGLESVDALKDGVYYITVQGTREDLSFYHLDLSQGRPVTNTDGSITYSWTIPVVPSGSLGGQDNQAYVVKENKHFIPGYTCEASYEIVHGDGSHQQATESGSGATAKPITIYTNKNGSVDFTNVYTRADIGTSDREYVIDFGLPLDFTIGDLNLTMSDENGVEVPISERGVQVTKLELDGDATYEYGSVALIADDESTEAYDPVISYTPAKIADGPETIPVNVWVNGRERKDYDFNLVIYPATQVYYEEEFLTFTDNRNASNGFGTWTDSARSRSKQVTEALGDLKNVYGYDPAYASGTEYSMNSAKQVKVNAATGKNGEAPVASFTFTGTGFDIISLTDNTSGTIRVTVKKGDEVVKTQMVNNYYGYTYNKETGEWTTCDSTAANALYQIPVIKISGLEYDEYTVTVEATYLKFADKTAAEGYTFLLDAIRIYDPMGSTIDDKYAQDGEDTPQYKMIRNMLVDQNAFTSDAEIVGSVFIDGIADGSASLAQYEAYGPNNEVYLANGQSIAFQLQVSNISDINNLNLHIGAKLVKGDGAGLLLNNNEYVRLATATDMYYDLGSKLGWTDNNGVYTANVALSNGTDGSIISLTNLKLTGNASFVEPTAPALLSAEEAPKVRMMVSRSIANSAIDMFNGTAAEEAPADVFVPESLDVKWNACSAGGYATLTVTTSTDVDKLFVDGKQVTNVYENPTVEIVDNTPVMHYHKVWTAHIQMMNSGEHMSQITAYNAEGLSSDVYESSVIVY